AAALVGDEPRTGCRGGAGYDGHPIGPAEGVDGRRRVEDAVAADVVKIAERVLIERCDAVRAHLRESPQQRLVELAGQSVVEGVSADERVVGGIRRRRQRYVDLSETLVHHRLETEAAVNDRIRPAGRVREDDLIRSVRNAGAAGVGDMVR